MHQAMGGNSMLLQWGGMGDCWSMDWTWTPLMRRQQFNQGKRLWWKSYEGIAMWLVQDGWCCSGRGRGWLHGVVLSDSPSQPLFPWPDGPKKLSSKLGSLNWFLPQVSSHLNHKRCKHAIAYYGSYYRFYWSLGQVICYSSCGMLQVGHGCFIQVKQNCASLEGKVLFSIIMIGNNRIRLICWET